MHQESGDGRGDGGTWSWIHVAAFVGWVSTWVAAILLSGGQTQFVADTGPEYVGFAVLFGCACALVLSAVKGGLEIAGERLSMSNPLTGVAAMLGLYVPDAVSRIRTGRRA